MRNRWTSLLLLSVLLIVGINSCDDPQPIEPPEPVEKFIRGKVIDDRGTPQKNVTVTVYSQDVAIGGDNYIASVVTDSVGEWETTVLLTSPVRYTFLYSRSGLFDVIQSFIVSTSPPDTITIEPPVAVPPTDMDDILRIVLTWGSVPPDLDAHLTGPKGDGNRFHVYWDNKVAYSTDGQQIARLISDRRNGFGPETIAIKNLIPGSENYRFSVHNYSRNDVEGDTTLVGLSNARVRIFSQNGLEHEFAISGEDGPSTTIGNTWRVFEIDGETGDVIEINEMFDGIKFDDDEVFKLENKPDFPLIPGK